MPFPKIAEIAESLSKLAEIVEALNKKVEALSEKPVSPPVVATPTPPEPSVPENYRRIVNAVLNSEFGIRVESTTNPGIFRFIILVPKKYSDATEAYWSMYHEDPHIFNVEAAHGDEGIRLCVEKAFNGFNPTTQALITTDRK